ncbi:MAG TPA: SMC-Scp complex subunit ScpB [Ruminococcus sp.]|nr:SMC-Scp complex subunit ScpB [Ruminococcus sp.]
MKLENEIAALEAILFASGEPMEAERLAEALGADPEHPLEIAQVAAMAAQLAAYLDETGSGMQLLQLSGSYQLATRPEHAQAIKTALEVKRNTPLSNAAMEALTIIAYNQPVTKGFVERVRGVDSGSVVNTLVERGLLEEAGRIEVPGRPVTYRTTAHFLRTFGLQSLSDLPPLPTETEPDLFEVETEEGDFPAESNEADQPEETMDNLETVEADEHTEA